MIDSLDRLDKAIGSRTRANQTHEMRELLEHATNVQDLVLDSQRSWINELPVSEEHQIEIFKRLCVATGKLIDGIFLGVNFEPAEQ